MSANESSLETQPVIEIVSDDVILPVIESSILERTKKQYEAMESEQQRDFWLAVASTFGGVALTATAFIVEKKTEFGNLPTYLRAAGYALDYADGYFAKRTATIATTGATTEFGAVADPLADKFNNTLNEIALVQEGRLRPSDLAIRCIRDLGITAARRFVTKQTNGKVDVKANRLGKLNTVIRDGVNLFASTQAAEAHPVLNRALQTGANLYSVASGLYTAHTLAHAYRQEVAETMH